MIKTYVDLIACVGDEDVSTESFDENAIDKIIASEYDSEQWEYSDTFEVFKLLDGRFAYVGEYSWGTCDICGGEDEETIVSSDLNQLITFGLPEKARAFLAVPLQKYLEDNK
jgi:hypothetical protein